MNVGLEHFQIVSAVLFGIGLLGVLIRRNIFVIYMGLEMMLNAANLSLVSFSRFNN
ncbi:MAG: NADH-quinone oxidoreductase subunit NuoK, partial [Verrucomicrobiae bacterium]|nr:NADH-quinone oxidoreductase subunit NuoK [Verrucomicrobiae bacterium]